MTAVTFGTIDHYLATRTGACGTSTLAKSIVSMVPYTKKEGRIP